MDLTKIGNLLGALGTFGGDFSAYGNLLAAQNERRRNDLLDRQIAREDQNYLKQQNADAAAQALIDPARRVTPSAAGPITWNQDATDAITPQEQMNYLSQIPAARDAMVADKATNLLTAQKLKGLNLPPEYNALAQIGGLPALSTIIAKQLTPSDLQQKARDMFPGDPAAQLRYMQGVGAKDMYVPDMDPLNRAKAQSEIDKNKATAANQSAAMLSDEAADFIADQLLQGDQSGLQGLGYGNAGAANRAKVRDAVQRKAQALGLTGKDLAAINAEFFGMKSAQRTLGTRSANIEMAVNEAANMGKLAREASTKVPRGNWMPINAAMRAWNENSGKPEQRAFGAAVNSFLNAYATAVGKGTMTVDARNHAAEMLSTADGPMAFNAIMDQLDREMQAAREAPGQVRGTLRDAVTGVDSHAQQPAASIPPGTPSATAADGHKIYFINGKWQ